MPRYPSLYEKEVKEKPARRPGWSHHMASLLMAPLKSRGRFSPRLLMAWVTLGFTFWLIRRWITTEPKVLNNILVLPRDVVEVVGILIGLVGLLLGLGTFQKVQLGDTAPAPGLNEVAANENTKSE